MLNSRKQIKTFAAQNENDLRLLASNPYLKQITSMCNRRGVPDPVKAAQIIEWDCWKIDGTFSFELFRAFSSMHCGRGLINDQAQVVEMLAWDCLQPDGEFSMELLRAVSSMMSCHGFPDKDSLTAMLAWNCWRIDGNFRIELLRIFSSMMSGCGIPEKEKVEGILSWPCWQVDGKFSFELLRTFSSMSHGRGLIKQAEVERVLAWDCWKIDGKFSIKLLRTFSSMLHGNRHRRFTLTLRRRLMLEILWPQSEDNHLRYAEKLDTLLKTVPTIHQLYRLHQAFKPQKLQAFLEACLARENMAGQSINETVPEIKTQEILLEGLLLSNHYLSDHGHIPKLCFSKQVASADGFGVLVDGDAEMSGHLRLWHFIAAMLIELKQTEYQFKRQHLRISPPDSEPIVLPKPEFTAADTGFVITNWSPEQLTAFFQATEFTDHWYRNPQDTRNTWAIRQEQKLRQMRPSPQNITQTGHRAGHKSSRSLLPPSVIINIIKQGNRLKPTVWSSLERYAKNCQLTVRLCRLLAPVIEKELANTAPDAIPEIVKKTVAERLRKTGSSQTAALTTASQLPSSTSTLAATPAPFASPMISPSQMLPATLDTAIDMAMDTMARDMSIEELKHFPVLGKAELDMLAPLRDQMTYPQLMDVITKIDLQSVESEIVLAWQQTFENRRRDNLGLDLDELLDSLLEGADD